MIHNDNATIAGTMPKKLFSDFRSVPLLSVVTLQIDERDEESSSNALLTTEFFEWCCKYFTEPLMSVSAENDPHGTARFEHEYRFQRAAKAQRQALHDHHRASKCLRH